MNGLDDIADLFVATTAANPAAPAPKKCYRHAWMVEQQTGHTYCQFCGKHKDEARSRRNRNNKKRGTSDEPRVAAILGGRAIGPLKLPWDVEIEGYLRAQAKKYDTWPSINEIIKWLSAIPAGEHMRAVTLADTPGAGKRVTRLIVMPLYEFARWHGRAAE